MYYIIDSILRKCSKEECHNGKKQYVAMLSPEEWIAEKTLSKWVLILSRT
jgi:magnesium transporter